MFEEFYQEWIQKMWGCDVFPWTVWRDVTCTSSCDRAVKIWNFSTSFSFLIYSLASLLASMYRLDYLYTHTTVVPASCARSKCTSRLSMATGLTDACCVPAPPASHVEEGKEENIVGLDIYVTGPASATKAVILVPDIFGWKGPLLRKLADKVASKGYLALVPDYFRGHALDEGVDFSKIGGWLQEYHPSTCVSPTLELIEYLKKTRGIADVGISGFCYGGKVAFIVGANPNLPAKTLVLLHPSLTAPEDFEDLKVPVAILAAESDNIEKFRSLIDKRKKELEIFVKSFKQPHGWTVRYKPSSDEAVKAAEEAHEIMLDWYSKHL